MTHANFHQPSLNFLQVAEVKLVYITQVKPSERPTISSPRDAHRILFQSWDPTNIQHVETSKILLLNRANRVLGLATIATGGIAGCIIDPIVVFQYAIKSNSCAIILAHNHPSGNTAASESDRAITKKVKEGAELFNIQLLDHIILTPEEEVYTSFADLGYL